MGIIIFFAGYIIYDFLNVYKETSVYTDTIENMQVAVHSKTEYDGKVYKSDTDISYYLQLKEGGSILVTEQEYMNYKIGDKIKVKKTFVYSKKDNHLKRIEYDIAY